MNMVDRIRTILQAWQLSSTQFADAIGVARPIMSHILSGRNKPSLEVVQKILAAFPDLSMAWLLNGTDPMLAATPAAPPSTTSPAPLAAQMPVAAPPVRQEAPQAKIPAPSRPSLQRFVVPAAGAGAAALPASFRPAPAPYKAPAAEPVATQPATPPPAEREAAVADEPVAPAAALSAGLFAVPGKSIRRIVIFYSDGSFADYKPE